MDFTPLLRFGLTALVLALAPLAWVWLRHRGAAAPARQRALTLLTLFLTFDLVLFGAFTRLTDSGLGCPDWPGCYGHASPFGAREQIDAAQAALPSGPVTHGKAWIEMVHRYLAAAVGVLILVGTVAAWRSARRGESVLSPWWPTATLVWVCIQGAFGALTVTMKLYPAIVTLHLLGGMGLLVLLAAQAQAQAGGARPLHWSPRLAHATLLIFGLTVVQIALGGWVSTNYAVLACNDFPRCQGQWWPPMDFARGFEVRRELGVSASGGFLPFEALTAIHYAHRLMACVLLLVLVVYARALRSTGDSLLRRCGLGVALLACWQLASGLSNVLLGWPLLGAVAHTAGAAALIILLTGLLARARVAVQPTPAMRLPGRRVRSTS